MQLVVITKEGFFAGEPRVLNNLFERGLEGLHLRKPGASDQEMRSLIKRVSPEFHQRIIIHGHPMLHAEFGLWGVHFPLLTLIGKSKLQHGGEVSCSAHTEAEVAAISAVVSRLFVSPIFDSISKKGYRGRTTLLHTPESVGRTAALVALGGITPERLPVVHQHGFKAAALMGYVWEGEPLRRFETSLDMAANLRTTDYATP